MKIYTKQGDTGQTQVFAKEVLRLDKDDALLECYGTLDELNAWVGLIHTRLATLPDIDATALENHSRQLQAIQQHLFAIGFAISDQAQLSDEMITALELAIDAMQQQLPPQTKFILPGGHPLAGEVHVSRTVARRAERRLVSLNKQHNVHPLALSFVNRLSDYLFVFSRWLNHNTQYPDVEV